MTASNTPVLIRLFTCTFATAGTTTAGAVQQVLGRTIAATNMTSNLNYTAEPTVKSPFDEFSVTPNGGTVIYDYPLGDEPDYFNSGAMGFGIDMTTPSQTVGFIATLWVSRI